MKSICMLAKDFPNTLKVDLKYFKNASPTRRESQGFRCSMPEKHMSPMVWCGYAYSDRFQNVSNILISEAFLCAGCRARWNL